MRRALEKLGENGHEIITEAQAREVLESAMRVLFYRDARSLNKVSCRSGLLDCMMD